MQYKHCIIPKVDHWKNIIQSAEILSQKPNLCTLQRGGTPAITQPIHIPHPLYQQNRLPGTYLVTRHQSVDDRHDPSNYPQFWQNNWSPVSHQSVIASQTQCFQQLGFTRRGFMWTNSNTVVTDDAI